jgi:hypothetical protein
MQTKGDVQFMFRIALIGTVSVVLLLVAASIASASGVSYTNGGFGHALDATSHMGRMYTGDTTTNGAATTMHSSSETMADHIKYASVGMREHMNTDNMGYGSGYMDAGSNTGNMGSSTNSGTMGNGTVSGSYIGTTGTGGSGTTHTSGGSMMGR